MSAHDYYQPHVYIDGQRLGESAVLAGLTPIADIAIKWGATDWWQNFDASTLTFTILDPLGELLALDRGASVVVTCDPDGRTIFRGELDASTATFTHRTTPDGHRIPVWEVEVEAFDPLAALAADRAHGETYPTRNAAQNVLHWGRQLISERFDALAMRSPVPISWDYDAWWRTVDQHLITSPNQYVYPCAPYTTQQNVSVLHVLRKSARILHPLYRPYFDHELNRIRLLRPQSPEWIYSSAAARYSAGQLTLVRTGGDILAINANRIEPVDGTIRLDLNPQDNLTRAALAQRREELVTPQSGSGFWGNHYDVVDQFGTTVSVGTESQSSVELETDLSAGWEWPPSATNEVATLMRSTRDWRSLPRIRYYVGKTAAANPVLHNHLFRAQPSVIPGVKLDSVLGLALVNTPLQWSASLPHFSIVGGELTYSGREGWRVDANPAGIPTESATGTTLAGPWETKLGNVSIGSAAPEFTVADFQLI